ncbi:polymorphic toxin-type HINT domain-containing protein [Nonomuraea bangladeshensis]|uniref:polymorphic toxin-type HINT domain-containing protein n=1 Tax=Nonomuraea bangladeshensis TaxID=404385 RepID=UPI003C304F45
MRRYSAWARSPFTAASILTVLLPGLLGLAAGPAQAEQRAIESPPGAVSLDDIPRQQMGTAVAQPSLVPASATRAPSPQTKAKTAKSTFKLPKGALQPDARTRSQQTQQRQQAGERRLPPGAARAEALEAAVLPDIDDMWPLDGAQVGSISPTLVAHATGDSSELQYAFTVCKEPAGQDEEGLPYEFWCYPYEEDGTTVWPVYSDVLPAGVNSWKVPAGELKWGTTYAWKVVVSDPSGAEIESTYRSFVTGARQPNIGSQLANREASGQEFHALSGNYTSTVTDASVATTGPALSVVRSYNSLDARRDGLFGAGWSTRFDMKIEVEPSGALLVTYPDGRRLRFAPKGGGSFQPPPGMHATLAAVTGGGWKLMDKSSTVYHFNAQGRLTKIVDARGRAMELTYGTDGKLAKATAVGGRSLTFGWIGGHVTSVTTDPVDGAAQRWTYSYDGDKLLTACNPNPAQNCTTYSYTTGSLYRGLVEDDEPVGYWRLGEPASVSSPSPPPDYCTVFPEWCEPQPTTEARSLGWGAGLAEYSGVSLEQPGALAGSADTAAGFNGQGALGLPDKAIARLTDQLSLELWFKTTTSGILAYASEAYADGMPMLYVGTDGKLRGQFRIVGSSGSEVISPIASPSAVTNGQWHHVVLAGSGNSQTLYLDGAALGTRTGSINNSWLAGVSIGDGFTSALWPASKPPGSSWPPASWGFVGHVDELALYDRPLTAGEVSEHFQARTAAPHLLSKITLPSGRVWANNTYDPAKDRLKTHTDQHGGTWKLGEPTPVDVATGATKVTVSDPNNDELVTEHDAWRGYRTTARTDQLGKKTTYDYDAGGYPNFMQDANGIYTERVFDKRGNMLLTVQCEDPVPGTIVFFSCLFQLPQEAFLNRWLYSYHVNKDNEFDPRNDRVTKVRDGRSASETDNTYAVSYEYSTFGELTKQTTPATLDFPNGRSATTAYTDGSEPAVGGGTTPAGLVKTGTDFKGNVTTYTYTAAGDLAQQTDPAGLVTKYGYDALGRATSKTQVSGAEPNGVSTSYTYDGLGQLATVTAPGVKNEISDVVHTAKTTYTYDPDGNQLSETVTDLTGGDSERITSFTYDAHGLQETSTDAEGGVIRTTWNTLGLQATLTDELGAIFGYTYTKRGELASRTLKNWTGSPVNPQPAKEITLESFSYDPAGRLAAQVDAMNRKTSYLYYADDSLFQVIADDVRLNKPTNSPRDLVLEEYTYDAAGNLTKLVTPGPTTGSTVTSTYVHDAANRLTSTTFDTTTLKRKTAYEYDANDQVTKQTRTGAGSNRAETTSYAYNPAGITTRQTIENGAEDLTTTWDVDDRGLVTAITDPRGNTDGATTADYTTNQRYDALGRLIEVKAPSVQIERAGAAAAGRPTARIGYDTGGRQTHVIDPEGRLATSGFDRNGRQTSLTAMPYTPPGGATVTPEMGYAYDPAGRLTKITDPRGHATSIDYDALGNPVRVTDPSAAAGQPAGQWISEYDLLGEELTSIDPTGARTQATYDDLGRPITQTVVERKPTSAAYVTTYEYNDAGYLTKQVRPGNRTTGFTLYSDGQVKTESNPAGNTTSYAYDLAGRPAKVTNALGNAMVGAYDLAGRLTGLTSLDHTGATVRARAFGYDAAGNMTSSTSGEGHVTRARYDATNLLTELIEPVTASKSITTSFGYDAAGAHTRITDGRGNATWTGYNSLGLIETLTEPATTAHPNPADRTWTHVYDAAGNETALIQPGGVRLDSTYDALNRVTTISGSGAGIVAADKTYSYDLADRTTTVGDQSLEYNDRGLLTKLSSPSGPASTFAYDAVGNPTQRVDATGTTTYTWDAADRLKTVTDPVSGRTNTYDYDQADRLATITSANPVNTQVYTYDAVDRPLTHTLKNSSGGQLAKITYRWDKDDNLTSKKTEGLAGAGDNTYAYDHAGRLTSWTGPDGTTTSYEWDDSGNRTRAGDKTYTYDERNRLTEGDGSTYTYTPRGTLASQTKNGSTRYLTFDAFDRLINDGEAVYTYDAFDRMATRQKSGGAQQRFLYAGLDNDIVAITDAAGAVQARYGRDPFGALVSVQEGTAPAAGALTDLHDLVGTFSGTALSSTTTYNPYGEVTAQTGTKPSLGYQSEYTDPDTGTVNMHARWYQPGTGTFTSRDTWTLPPIPSIQANRYTYVNGSPLTGVDPSGHGKDLGGGGGGGGPAVLPGPRPAAPAPRAPNVGTGAVAGAVKAAQSAAKAARAAAAAAKAAEAAREVTRARNQTKTAQKPKEDLQKEKNLCKTHQCGRNTESAQKGGVKQTAGNVRRDKKPACTTKCAPAKPPTCKGNKKCGVRKTAGVEITITVDTKVIKRPPTCVPGQPCTDFIDLSGSVEITLGGVLDLPGDDAAPSGDDIIRCDNGQRFSGQCSDGVAVVDPDEASPGLGDWVPSPSPIYSCGEPNSFIAGTRVLMANGGTKPIEDVKIGDKVVAADPETGRTESRPVTALIEGKGVKHLVKITVDVGTAGSTAAADLVATDNHPFWVPELQRWVAAAQLQPGVWLRTSAGTHVQIARVQSWIAVHRVYNLTVDDLHTYHVVAGDQAILVHNAGPGRGLGDDEIYLWRAVQDHELAGIHENRSYHNPPGYETKYFAFTEEGAREYGRRAYAVRPQEGPYTVTRTTIQRGKIPPSSIMPPTADVPGGGVALPTDLLDELGRPRIMPQSSC